MRRLTRVAMRMVGLMLMSVGVLAIVAAAFGPDENVKTNLVTGLCLAALGTIMGGWKVLRPRARVYVMKRVR